MTKAECNALLGYIEFNLITMIEQYQSHYIDKLGFAPDDIAVGILHDEAYEVLNELERTLSDQTEVATQ